MIASDAIGQLDHDRLDRPDSLSNVIPVCFMTPSEKMMGVAGTQEVKSEVKPALDIRIPFDKNQSQLSPAAVPYVKALGEALSSAPLKGDIFEIQGIPAIEAMKKSRDASRPHSAPESGAGATMVTPFP
jgi:hypothetical protein